MINLIQTLVFTPKTTGNFCRKTNGDFLLKSKAKRAVNPFTFIGLRRVHPNSVLSTGSDRDPRRAACQRPWGRSCPPPRARGECRCGDARGIAAYFRIRGLCGAPSAPPKQLLSYASALKMHEARTRQLEQSDLYQYPVQS